MVFRESGVLFLGFAVVYISANLSRYFASYPLLLRHAGEVFRHALGNGAPLFEHFAAGVGGPLAFGAVLWPFLYLLLPRIAITPAKGLRMASVQSWLKVPSRSRDIVVMAFPVVLPIWEAWDWELCQASGRCKGGNLDGSVQYDQLCFDHLGAIAYLVLITLFVLVCWSPRRMQRA